MEQMKTEESSFVIAETQNLSMQNQRSPIWVPPPVIQEDDSSVEILSNDSDIVITVPKDRT